MVGLRLCLHGYNWRNPGRAGLTATATGTNSIQLTWTVPEQTTARPITGYELQRWNGTAQLLQTWDDI